MGAGSFGRDREGLRGAEKVWYAVPLPSAPRIRAESYKVTEDRRQYKCLVAECPHHANCTRKRSRLYTKAHGVGEPLFFLVAWAALGDGKDRAAHESRRCVPTKDAVRIVAESLADEVVAQVLDSLS